jgi:hypothetical protein
MRTMVDNAIGKTEDFLESHARRIPPAALSLYDQKVASLREIRHTLVSFDDGAKPSEMKKAIDRLVREFEALNREMDSIISQVRSAAGLDDGPESDG